MNSKRKLKRIKYKTMFNIKIEESEEENKVKFKKLKSKLKSRKTILSNVNKPDKDFTLFFNNLSSKKIITFDSCQKKLDKRLEKYFDEELDNNNFFNWEKISSKKFSFKNKKKVNFEYNLNTNNSIKNLSELLKSKNDSKDNIIQNNITIKNVQINNWKKFLNEKLIIKTKRKIKKIKNNNNIKLKINNKYFKTTRIKNFEYKFDIGMRKFKSEIYNKNECISKIASNLEKINTNKKLFFKQFNKNK